jgi:hypothetical protein
VKAKLPSKIKIGNKWFKVNHVHEIRDSHTGKPTIMGRINYKRQIIEVAHKYPAVEVRNTFWHEMTHGILEDMGHELCDNERFVTAFANRLSDAIDSAKF